MPTITITLCVCVSLFSLGLETLHKTSEGLGEMFEGDLAGGKISVYVAGVPSDCVKHAQTH